MGTGDGRRTRTGGSPLGQAAIAVALLAAMGCSEASVPTASGPRPDARTVRCTQDFGDPAASAYRLPWPAGRSYRIIQGYCAPNPAWGHHDWLAYDFDLSIGDTVVASRSGRVIASRDGFADGTRQCGEENWVVVEHEDGTVLQYVHLTRGGSLVRVGQDVAGGEPIALSGDSGCSIGPHLHVALFRDRTNFGAGNTAPMNYHNAQGPLDSRHGLMEGQRYEALPDPSGSGGSS